MIVKKKKNPVSGFLLNNSDSRDSDSVRHSHNVVCLRYKNTWNSLIKFK